MVKTSPTILKDTKNYLNAIVNVNFKDYTAIIFRMADKRNQLVNSGHSRDDVIWALRQCLEDLRVVLQQDPSSIKVLCIDLGRIGDLTSRQYFDVNDDGNKLFKLALQIVYGNKNIDEYENEFVRAANGIEDRGYVHRINAKSYCREYKTTYCSRWTPNFSTKFTSEFQSQKWKLPRLC